MGTQAADLRGARLGKAPLELPVLRQETPRVTKREAVQEHHRVVRGSVTHVFERQRVGSLLEDSRPELRLDGLLGLAVPARLAHLRSVHEHTHVVVRLGLEIARPLQPHAQARGRRAPREMGEREGVALGGRRHQEIPLPQVSRVEQPCLVDSVLLPVLGVEVLEGCRAAGSCALRGHRHSWPACL